jgi:hypothetical protein
MFNNFNYPSDPKKIRTHLELECDSLDKIQQEILEWVDKNTNFLTDTTDDQFWKKIEYKDLGKRCPSLLHYMKSIKMPIREIVIGLLTEAMKDDGFVLHIGAPPLNFKINFPILNTEDVYTEWYDIPTADLDRLNVMINEHTNTPQYDLSSLHSTVHEKYELITRYNMHKCPIVFNSWIPHRVIPGPGAKFPRIMIATMPINDPIHLMKK